MGTPLIVEMVLGSTVVPVLMSCRLLLICDIRVPVPVPKLYAGLDPNSCQSLPLVMVVDGDGTDPSDIFAMAIAF